MHRRLLRCASLVRPLLGDKPSLVQQRGIAMSAYLQSRGLDAGQDSQSNSSSSSSSSSSDRPGTPPAEHFSPSSSGKSATALAREQQPRSVMAEYAAVYNRKGPRPLPDHVYRHFLERAETMQDAYNIFSDYVLSWTKRLSVPGSADAPDLAVMHAAVAQLRPKDAAESPGGASSAPVDELCQFGGAIFQFMLQHRVRDIHLWAALPQALLANYAQIFPSSPKQAAVAQFALDILNHAEFRGNWVQFALLSCRAYGYLNDSTAVQRLYNDTAPTLIMSHNASRQQAFGAFIAAFARCGDFEQANGLLIHAIDIDLLPDVEAAWCLLQLSGKTNPIQVTQRLFDVVKVLYYGDSSARVSELVSQVKRSDNLSPANFRIFASINTAPVTQRELHGDSKPQLQLQSQKPTAGRPPVSEPAAPAKYPPPQPFDLYSAMLYCYALALKADRFKRHQSLDDYLDRRLIHVAWCRLVTEARMLQWSLNIEGYESLLTCYVYGNYDDYNLFSLTHVSRFLEEMLSRGIFPTRHVIHTIIRGYVNTLEKYLDYRTRARFVSEYMEFLTSCGYDPTAETYSIYFLTYLPRRRLKNPLPTVTQSLRRTEQLMFDAGVAHTTESMNTLLRVYGAHQMYREVNDHFMSMAEHQVPRNARTYATVLRACQVSRFSAQYALQTVYPEMLRDPNVGPMDWTMYHTVMACAVTAQDHKLAWQLYEDMCTQRQPITHSIFNYLLKLTLFNDQPAKAEYLLTEMWRRRMFFDATTYYHLLTYFTRVQHSPNTVFLLLQRLHQQNEMAQLWQHELAHSTTNTPVVGKSGAGTMEGDIDSSLSMDVDALTTDEAMGYDEDGQAVQNVVYRPPPKADALEDVLKLPPKLPYPRVGNISQHQRPVYVSVDTRMRLKIIQHHLAYDGIKPALKNFNSLVNDFALVMLNRQMMTRVYRNRFAPDLESTAYGKYPNKLLSPNVLHLRPLNGQPGSLFMGKDVATATWLLCNHLLTTLKNSHRLPTIRTVEPEYARVHGRYRNLTERLRSEDFRLHGRPMFLVARRVFCFAYRVLKRYVGTRSMSSFEWVIDLARKLAIRSGDLEPRLRAHSLEIALKRKALGRGKPDRQSSAGTGTSTGAASTAQAASSDGKPAAQRHGRKYQRITVRELLWSINRDKKELNKTQPASKPRPTHKMLAEQRRWQHLVELYRTKQRIAEQFRMMKLKHRIRDRASYSKMAPPPPPSLTRPWKWKNSSSTGRNAALKGAADTSATQNLGSNETLQVPLQSSTRHDDARLQRRRKRGGQWLKRRVSKRFVKAIDEQLAKTPSPPKK
ncbi:hypothetical protein RI367_004451 [Sorochytrium milnesiophthora]